MDEVDLALVIIPVLGIACLWAASQVHIPAILLLLPGGILVGPVFEIVDPDALFGESLYPAVSLAVAVLLFDGGLGLRFDQLEGRTIVARLISFGVLLTFGVGFAAGALLFDAPTGVVVVLAAVLVVSGPTVVGPILAQVRPREPSASILRWEGIVIDPIGATLAILMVGIVIGNEHSALAVAEALAVTIAAGMAIGGIGALAYGRAVRAHIVPDHLQAVVSIGMALAVFGLANEIRPEAGLFAATVFGVALANQSQVTVGHLAAFGESISQVLLAILFVVLGAAISLDALEEVLVPALALAAVLVFIARPLAVVLATLGTGLEWRDRAFMAWLAPRGIVAASVSAVFTVQLTAAGVDASILTPVAFIVIIATVTLYGLTARPMARLLGVAEPPARGLVLIGAPAWSEGFIRELRAAHVPLLVVTDPDTPAPDTLDDRVDHVTRLEPEALHSAAEHIGARQVLATGSSEALDELGIERLVEVVGRPNVFRLPLRDDDTAEVSGRTRAVRARRAFSHDTTRAHIDQRLADGAAFTTVEPHDVHDDDLVVARVSAEGAVAIANARLGRARPRAGERFVVVRGGAVPAERA